MTPGHTALALAQGQHMHTSIQTTISTIDVPAHFPELGTTPARAFVSGTETEPQLAPDARAKFAKLQLPELSQGARPRHVPPLAWLAMCTQSPVATFAVFTGCIAMSAVYFAIFRTMRTGTFSVPVAVTAGVLLILPIVLGAFSVRKADRTARMLKGGGLAWGVLVAGRTIVKRGHQRPSRDSSMDTKAPQVHYQFDYVFEDCKGELRLGRDQTRIRGDGYALLEPRFVLVCHDSEDADRNILVGMIPGKLRMNEKGEVVMSTARQLAGLVPILMALIGPAVLAWFLAMGVKTAA